MPRVRLFPALEAVSVAALFGFLAPPVRAQDTDPAILETAMAAYSAISANEGEMRDWPAFHALFLPDARLVNVRGNDADGFAPQSMSVAEWVVANMTWLEGRGFVEDVVHYNIESYGPIAHVFTSWTTRRERGGAEQSLGAATLQLVKTPDGWRVASWIWTGEQEGLALPGRYEQTAPLLPPTVALPQPVDSVLSAYERAWSQRDADGLAALFTEDGFVLRPGNPPEQGREAIRRAYANSGGALALRAYGYGIAGEVGYVVGGFSRRAGEPDIGKFILALRRAPSGSWLISADMDNANQ